MVVLELKASKLMGFGCLKAWVLNMSDKPQAGRRTKPRTTKTLNPAPHHVLSCPKP